FIAYAQTHPAICSSAVSMLLGLLEAIVNRIADVLERVGAELDAISSEVFAGGRRRRRHPRDFRLIRHADDRPERYFEDFLRGHGVPAAADGDRGVLWNELRADPMVARAVGMGSGSRADGRVGAGAVLDIQTERVALGLSSSGVP